MSPPLSDLVVVEVAGDVAGQFCGKSLAGLGARVIKVEPPEGDPLRRVGPFAAPGDNLESGALFLWLNTGKESVTLDLDTPEGQDLLDRLSARAGVLVAGPAFTAEALHHACTRFPELVIVSLSPFGLDGPHAAWKADDLVLAAMTGWMHMTGKPDREPLGTFETLPSAISGLAAASAALMAVHERSSSGLGQLVEVSAQEVLALCTAYISLAYSYSGVERPRSGMPFPMTIVPAVGGYLGVNVLTQAQWEGLCRFAGLDHLLQDPGYATPLARAQHSAELTALFAGWARDRDASAVFHQGQQWRVPFGYVPEFASVFDLDVHAGRHFFESVEHPVAGRLQYTRPPFLVRELPDVHRAPLLGEHNASALPPKDGTK